VNGNSILTENPFVLSHHTGMRAKKQEMNELFLRNSPISSQQAMPLPFIYTTENMTSKKKRASVFSYVRSV
jgi:hypothetical protein